MLSLVVALVVALAQAQLPVPGFGAADAQTALVITDPQNDFLGPEGVAWPLVKGVAEEQDTIVNLRRLMKSAKENNVPVFIAPHWYYPTKNTDAFGGAVEKLMTAINMFGRTGKLSLEGFARSGADWIPSLRAYINDDKTVICNEHKVYGPQTTDLYLQLAKSGITKVLLAGMSANLCVESHMRALIGTACVRTVCVCVC